MFNKKEKYYEEYYKKEEYDTNPGNDESKVDSDEDIVWCWNHEDKHKEKEEYDEEQDMKDKYDENFEEEGYKVNADGKSYEEYDADYEDKDEKSGNKVTAKYSIFNDEGLDEAEVKEEEIKKKTYDEKYAVDSFKERGKKLRSGQGEVNNDDETQN